MIQLHPGTQLTEFPIEIRKPKLWWTRQLGEQNFYHFKASISMYNEKVSELAQRTGLRSVKLVQEPDSIGKSFYFELNGIPVFMKGANYIPQDMFLNRINENDYHGVIKQATDANMNMLRVWGGGFYENDIFYNLCDEQGILIWQDLMFACSMYPGDQVFINNVKCELIDNIKRLRNHPCIALWCGNNENYIGWKDWKWKNKFNAKDTALVWADYEAIFHKLVPDLLNKYNTGSNYWPSSPKYGWGYPVNADGDSHYWGVWHAQEPFEELAKPIHIPRFMSEFGFQSCPDFNSVKKYTVPEDWSISSPVMKLHQKHRIGYPVIDKYMAWYYKKPKDYKAYLYVSQVLQASGMGYGIEIHRRSRPHCMGTLYWQLNDCYPVASWASVDYYDQWKAMHYRVKQVYADILISTVQEDSLVKVYIVSDKISSTPGKLRINLLDFSGKQIAVKELTVKVEPNSSKVYFKVSKRELLKNKDEKACLIETEFSDKTGTLAESIFYFVHPKDLELKNPEISVKSAKTVDGYELTVSSDVLAKNVYLSFDENEGFFTNNYFDIIPGKPVSVKYFTTKYYTDFHKTLKIYSLTDSF
jgi:beta-mannosidase